ncbi:site-specific integrase [Actinoalloteichus hymeniacidonis]|uniref:site-specific integrase n=1 Tax=Actinoalloteichus hymeniacidonis TaxID=340345 RepID=UPI0017E061BD|nr:site-specific integrase [Actinoalloteichus hymeniacidonis]MBB5908289.1 integrase [Actinoalloteichus hymeniacidonis]
MTERPDAVSEDRLPAAVQAALQHRSNRSVLVDHGAVAAVRDRFDTEQADALSRYLEASQSPNTLRAYRTDWIAWSAWCATEGRQALPADPVDVSVYFALAADARRAGSDPPKWAYSPATLDRKAAAIAAVHAANGLPSPTRADVVRLTLRGIRRTRRARQSRKRPVLLHTLEALLAERPDANWPGGVTRRRDTLLLLVGFAGALRRSELAALTFADVAAEVDPATGEPLLIVRLGVTKTDASGTAEQQVVLPRGGRPHTCPVCAFAAWTELIDTHRRHGQDGVRSLLADADAAEQVHRCHRFTPVAALTDLAMPLLPSVNRHGGIAEKSLSGRAVSDLVKRYALRAGLDPDLFGGHSLRAGFATQAALGGAGDREIMRQGRWSNPRTVHRYIRVANPLDDNAVTRLGL